MSEEAENPVLETLSGKRERKKPEHFSASLTSAKTPKKEVIYQGTGTQLVENETFCRHLDKHKGDDELIKLIHRLLFGTEGRKAEAKKNIRKFSGFSPGTVQADIIEKVSAKKAWTVSLLKSFAEMLGLEKGGAREAIIERIVEFLISPGLAPSKKGSGQKRPRTTEKAPKAKKAKKLVAEEEEKGEEDEAEEEEEAGEKEEGEEEKEEEKKEEKKEEEEAEDKKAEDEEQDEEPKEEVKEKSKAKASKAKKAPKAPKAAAAAAAKKETKKGSKKGSKKSAEKKEEAEDEDEEKDAAPAAAKEEEDGEEEEAAPVEETV